MVYEVVNLTSKMSIESKKLESLSVWKFIQNLNYINQNNNWHMSRNT